MTRAGRPVHLPPTEFRLLRYLMLDAGRVIPKDQILDHVRQSDWGRDAYIVETYVSYPRRKVDNPVGPDDRAVTPLIHTGRGFRYMLRETPA